MECIYRENNEKKTNLAGFDIEFNSNIGVYEYEWPMSVCVRFTLTYGITVTFEYRTE